MRTTSFRLTLLYVALSAASIFVLFEVVFWSAVGAMSRQMDGSIAGEIAEILAENAGKSLLDYRDTVVTLTSRSPQFFYLLQDAQGVVLAGRRPAVAPVLGVHDVVVTDMVGRQGRQKALLLRGKGIGVPDGGYLFVGISKYELAEMQEMLTRSFFWVMAVATLLTVVGGSLASRVLLGKIEAISETAKEIMSGNLSRRIPVVKVRDEFDHLATILNSMLDRIEALMQGMRQVSDDVAHDLRTPLAHLRQRLERARRGDDGIDAMSGSLDRSIEDVDKLLDTFGSLLAIAQMEASLSQKGFVDADLSVILASVVEIYQPAADDKAQTIVATIAPGLHVRGDPRLLTQLFANLLQNAIVHTPCEHPILVIAEQRQDVVRAEIADRGAGIPADQRDKVFGRFVRLERSRTTPGNGLGLSIVKAIVTLHDAQIELADNTPGLRAVVRFRLAAT